MPTYEGVIRESAFSECRTLRPEQPPTLPTSPFRDNLTRGDRMGADSDCIRRLSVFSHLDIKTPD